VIASHPKEIAMANKKEIDTLVSNKCDTLAKLKAP
jgi:hypothetical protein